MAREELKTIEGWHKSGCNSWDEYCKPGDMVDQGVADYFLDIATTDNDKGLLPGRRAAQSCNQPEDNEVLRHICNIRRKRKRNLGVLRKLFSSHVCRC